MALSLAIWNDLSVRMKNMRGDMIGQWQGDLDSRAIEQAVAALGNAVQMWDLAKPPAPPPAPPP